MTPHKTGDTLVAMAVWCFVLYTLYLHIVQVPCTRMCLVHELVSYQCLLHIYIMTLLVSLHPHAVSCSGSTDLPPAVIALSVALVIVILLLGVAISSTIYSCLRKSLHNYIVVSHTRPPAEGSGIIAYGNCV